MAFVISFFDFDDFERLAYNEMLLNSDFFESTFIYISNYGE